MYTCTRAFQSSYKNGPRHATCWSSGPETPHLCCFIFMQVTRCVPHNAILSQQIAKELVVHAGGWGFVLGMIQVCFAPRIRQMIFGSHLHVSCESVPTGSNL